VELPKELVPKLLNRFRSDEGYVLQPGAKHLLDKFRNQRKASSSHVMTGIITNSDDRVPGILSSLGLRVSPLRFGDEPSTSTWSEEAYDIDFSVMSYDVGAEKPDRRIFRAAEDMALIATADAPESDGEDAVWGCLYIGDDYASDVGGALNAGWKVVLLGREGETGDGENLERLPSGEAGDLFDILGYTDAVTCESLTQLACWLPESS
jgi:FMN phosphatase YigB (HAD superfamily)